MKDKSCRRRGRGRGLTVLIVAVVIAAAIAAAPAGAAPAATVLTVSAQSASISWGATGILNGSLQTTAAPPLAVDAQQVRVEFSATSLGPWRLADTVTNNAAPYSSGAYTYHWTATRNYYWRMNYLGTPEWAPVASTALYVKVKPVIARPMCPASARAGAKFTVYGSLRPKYPTGSRNVRVRAQRYTSGAWKAYKTYTATTANSGSYSKYSVRISITSKGKYRFYATTADTTTLAAGVSRYSRVMLIQ